jgi:periplasmic divalent cation tolerance protein
VESISQWNNQLETTQESQVIFKTKPEFFKKIQEVIEKNTRYEIPEIISIPLQEINPAYSSWLDESIT